MHARAPSTLLLDRRPPSSPSVSPNDDYLLCELGGLPVAVSSSLPTGQTFELVRTIRRASIDEIARATAAGEPVLGADALVLVDPVSTGAVVAYQAVHRMGLQIICVWSESIPNELKGFVAKGMAVPYAGMITHIKGELTKTVAAIRALGIPLAACIVGCETGVTLGDLLSEALRLPTNGTLKTGLRRNKYAQTEAVRSAGLEACFQMEAENIEGVEAFISAWRPSPYRAVVKPVEGAGSDGVSIVDSPDGVRRAFRALEGTKNVLGLHNYSVLLQEYLKGARRRGGGVGPSARAFRILGEVWLLVEREDWWERRGVRALEQRDGSAARTGPFALARMLKTVRG